MNLEAVTHDLLGASVEELAQTLRLIASRSRALQDTVVIDQTGRSVLSDTRQKVDALADALHN